MGTFETKLKRSNYDEIIYLKANKDAMGYGEIFNEGILKEKYPELKEGSIITATMFEFYNIETKEPTGTVILDREYLNNTFLALEYRGICFDRNAFTRVTKKEYDEQG